MSKEIGLIVLFFAGVFHNGKGDSTDYKVWGPGLQPHKITMPARYFFVEQTNKEKNNTEFDINISGKTKTEKPCRIWKNILDRKDGSYIVRYKLYEACSSMELHIKADGEHIAKSPYVINDLIYPDDCECEKYTMDDWLETWECGDVPQQITADLELFDRVNWDLIRDKVIKKYDNPSSVSLCHYIIKNNMLFRNCYGKYVGFKMFMDSILLSLIRKMTLPDVEFFVNLGDWPLVKDDTYIFPIFSWCASTDTFDIVMPTYDITESTLENMGRVMLDMLSVQGNVEGGWHTRIPKAFWRGRDSSRHRLNLIKMAQENPDLINASLTNFFFFRDEEHIYGPRTPHVSFFDFAKYKYQINVDGTVAAYRMPYLLAGGSLVFKQESKYYEHFYNELRSGEHYIPILNDLSDLVQELTWAINHDETAEKIASNAQKFAVENLLPKNIFCYYAMLLNEFSKRIVSKVKVQKGMDKVEQPDKTASCVCEGIEQHVEL